MKEVKLLLEDGSQHTGYSFGYTKSVKGEVVFNTGMVGYPESLTDPSYRGQILTFTYPLIGNYGMPPLIKQDGVLKFYESEKAQVLGIIVADYSYEYDHWNSETSLAKWLYQQKIPAITGIDTRSLTKKLRINGSMIGKLEICDDEYFQIDPNKEDVVPVVSIKNKIEYLQSGKKVALIDCGCKNSILRSLLKRNISVLKVPWDYDLSNDEIDGVVISNGPGNPKLCKKTISNVKKLIEKDIPILGICLGHQILALASGANTYKLKFGHRSQNQPCLEIGSKRCYITSQNHGYAVDTETLRQGWLPWFFNLNDGSNEGIRHTSKPFFSVQFHPEASPGPTDTEYIFDHFLTAL